MKKIVFLLSLLFFGYSTTIAQEWYYDIEQAKDLAKENNKKIFLLFTGSDWCPPCIKLERRVLSDENFLTFADKHFIMVKADFPKKKKNRLSEKQEEKNFKLAERYNKRMRFPVMLVLNEEGNVLGVTGYRKTSVERYMNLLASFEE
ncbi:thioredoxin family protein [Aquimarina hainanensis]|uniref:Thioredoxin family protein n=1 Tax=Aquimarina hainanensis TaxID=1578017 RepID=A0ABW5NDP4_9FLAO|nr:thioredoxin family protein [Aquimarina sp. TRL1]QKX06528.1 thioredoxin family protein [Aquimarina sp. TRL1]